MRTFIYKSIAYSSIVLVLHLLAANFADGTTDSYYLRFTSPPKSHLIIGTSKAAQGLRPQFLNEALGIGAEDGFLNYAFTLAHSPYGKTYRESVMRKITPECNDGIFIVCVDPWSISGPADSPDEPSTFTEGKRAVGTTRFVNMNPNYEYLLENYPTGWYKLVWHYLSPSPSNEQLHSDGWLSVNVSMDSTLIAKRTKRKVKAYEENLRTFAPSSARRLELEKTLEVLHEKGQVFMVRLPIGKEIAQVQEGYMPDFDYYIEQLTEESNIPYLDMRALPDTFRYTDGNHLHCQSAISVSKIVGEFIQENR